MRLQIGHHLAEAARPVCLRFQRRCIPAPPAKPFADAYSLSSFNWPDREAFLSLLLGETRAINHACLRADRRVRFEVLVMSFSVTKHTLRQVGAIASRNVARALPSGARLDHRTRAGQPPHRCLVIVRDLADNQSGFRQCLLESAEIFWSLSNRCSHVPPPHWTSPRAPHIARPLHHRPAHYSSCAAIIADRHTCGL